MPTLKTLLETYVRAKDKTQAHLIPSVFAPNAVLTFSIATDGISFPPLVVGADGIAQTLVTDFGAQYSDCKTYYICDALALRDNKLSALPWLVLMRHAATGRMRIGTGHYDWHLEPLGPDSWHATAMHIHIDRMDAVDAAPSQALARLQTILPYPWLSRRTMRSAFETVAASDPAYEFLFGYLPEGRHADQEKSAAPAAEKQ
jgi:hypothetical protein